MTQNLIFATDSKGSEDSSQSHNLGKRPRISFYYWDKPNEKIPYEESKSIYVGALKELYKHIIKKPVSKDQSLDAIRDELLSNYPFPENATSREVPVKVVRIDPNNKTDSFTGPMVDLKDFLPDSRRRFLEHAISYLRTLDPSESTGRNKLATALVKAREDGFLSGISEKAAADLALEVGPTTAPAGRGLEKRDDHSHSAAGIA